MLESAEVDSFNYDTRRSLAQVELLCTLCYTYSQCPLRFKFTPLEDKDLNHTVYADVLYIDGNKILHIVDEATRYQAAH